MPTMLLIKSLDNLQKSILFLKMVSFMSVMSHSSKKFLLPAQTPQVV